MDKTALDLALQGAIQSGNFEDAYKIEQQMKAAPTAPRDTTFGEKAGGFALDLGIGTMRATKAIPDLASFLLPDAVTDPASEFFERGIDAAEATKPEAYRAKQAQSFIERDAEGGFAGLQAPSVEHISGIILSSLPQIPAFLVGGGAVAKGLQATKLFKASPVLAEALGYGTVNAAMVAPDQWRQTYKEAIDAGMPEAEARDAADAAALMTAGLTAVTGAAGGVVASKLGAQSGSLPGAITKGFVGEAPFEGIEEGGQSIIGDVALGQQPDLVNALDAALSGAAAGAQGAGVAAVSHRAQPAAAPPPDGAQVLEALVQQASESGAAQALAGQPPAVPVAPEPIPAVQPAPEPAQAAPVPVQAAPRPVVEPEPAVVEEELTPEQIEKIEAKLTNVKKPPTLLDAIAAERIRLDRKKFRGDLAQQENLQVGNKWLFEGEKSEFEGMGPDELLEWMQQEGWLPENTPDAPNQVTANDAVDLLNRALRGERIVHLDNIDAELDFEQARQYEIDKAAGEGFGATTEEDATAFADIARAGENVDPLASEEEINQYFEDLWNTTESTGSTAWLQEGENVDQGTSEGGIPAGSATSEETGGLIPEPTQAEQLRAETEARTAQRDGLGRAEVRPEEGAGELFAGNEPGVRPTQADAFEEPSDLTSTKNRVAAAERAARDLDPVMQEARQSNPETVSKAEAAMAENPDLADETIARLANDPDPTISVIDEAVLFIAKVDLRRELRRVAERAADESLSEEQRLTASQKYNELLSRQNEIDLATHASGAVWGRMGQLRSRMMREDYSFEAQVLAFSARTGKAATAEQIAVIRQQAQEIQRLTARLEEANRKAQDRIDDFLTKDTYDHLVKQADKKKQPNTKQKLRLIRNQEVEWIRKNQGRLNAMPVDMVYHLAKLGSVIIAEGAVNFTTWAKRMKKALGDKIFNRIESDLDAIYKASQDQYQEDKAELADQTLQELRVEAEALSEVGEELTHRLVYQVARAHVLTGLRGENEVMQAVHADLEPLFEGLTERDVRRLFSEYGKAIFPSQDEDRKTLRELHRLVQLQESIDRLKEGLDPLRSGPQRDKATQEIREKQKLLNDLMRRRDRARPVASREKLASINEQRITRLENHIADLEKQIATGQKPVRGEPLPDSPEVAILKQKRDALKRYLQEIEEAKRPKPTAEEKYNELRGKQLRRELAEVKRRLREKDYAPRKRKEPPPLIEANKELRAEVIRAKMALHEQQMDWMRESWPAYKLGADYITQTISLSRAVMTSIDLSAVFRQGGFILLSDPAAASKAFIPMLRALRSEANARAINDAILSSQNAPLYEKMKIFLAEQDSAHPTKMEEVYIGRWQKKVPLVAASARAYVTFLNVLRATAADHALAHFSRKNGDLSIEELRELGAFINNSSGRFDLSKTGAVAGQGLSNIFFAPRWMLSRFAMILGVPMWRASPRMRKYIARQYAKYMMGLTGLYGLAALAAWIWSDDDEPPFQFDPRSTDFGKLRVGNTRLDMMSGLSQPLVFLSRVLSGGKLSGKGEVVPLRDNWRFGVPEGAEVGFGQDTGWTVAERFMRTKFAPPLTAMANMIDGQNVLGEDYKERGKFARDVLGLPAGVAENPIFIESTGMFTPLSMRDFYDALVEHGLPQASALQVLATLGVSMNTYAIDEKKKAERPKRPQRPKRPKRE